MTGQPVSVIDGRLAGGAGMEAMWDGKTGHQSWARIVPGRKESGDMGLEVLSGHRWQKVIETCHMWRDCDSNFPPHLI